MVDQNQAVDLVDEKREQNSSSSGHHQQMINISAQKFSELEHFIGPE